MSAWIGDAEYKYLVILEVVDFKHEGIDEIAKKEYFSRLSKLFKTKLNAKILLSANSTWAVSKAARITGNWQAYKKKNHHLQENVCRIWCGQAAGEKKMKFLWKFPQSSIESVTFYSESSALPLDHGGPLMWKEVGLWWVQKM